MDFGDVLDAIGTVFLHLAETAAKDPALQQALLQLVVGAFAAGQAPKK